MSIAGYCIRLIYCFFYQAIRLVAKLEMESKIQRIGHIAAVYGETILIWGGYKINNISGDYFDTQEVVQYHPITCQWKVLATAGRVPPPTSGACGVVVGDTLFVHGGYVENPDDEGNTNSIYCLNLQTNYWAQLDPSGSKPLHRDKLVGWEHDNKVYFFGGFGTPPNHSDPNTKLYQYVPDNSHSWYTGRGWNNQLVAYNIECNAWEWPVTLGQSPSPRAALAGFKSEENSTVYIYGGRLQRERMNDLYALDLSTMRWSSNLNENLDCPIGRSWHSFTAVSKSTAILYGGLTSDGDALDDCWMYNSMNNSWLRIDLKVSEKRVWHQGVHIDNELIIVGGVKNNMGRVAADHAEEFIFIASSPKSLLRLSLELCVRHTSRLGDSALRILPQHLQRLIRARRSTSN